MTFNNILFCCTCITVNLRFHTSYDDMTLPDQLDLALLTLVQISRLHSITDTIMLEKSGEDFSQGLHVMKRKWLRMYSGS